MKVFRRFLLFILLLAGLAIAIGLFLPAHVMVKRELVIKASPETVFKQINSLRNWPNWSPWHYSSTSLNVSYSGNNEGQTSTMQWKSNDSVKVNGRFTIIGSFPYDSLHLLMNFGESGESVSRFILFRQAEFTKLSWIVESHIGKNPISRWFGLFSDKFIGPDMEKGLSNLNNFIISFKNKNSYMTEVVPISNQIVLSITDSCLPANYSGTYDSLVADMKKFITKQQLAATGHPMAIFHTFNKQQFHIEVLIPIDRKIQSNARIKCYHADSNLYLKTEHYGNYKYASNAYEALYKEIEKKNLQVSGPPHEEYVKNASNENDTINWLTNIYIPVQPKLH